MIRPGSRLVWALLPFALIGCEAEGTGDEVALTIPSGASFQETVDTLSTRGLVGKPALFGLYARLRKDDRRIRSGRYVFREGDGWPNLLDALVAGRVVTIPVTIPEGFTLRQMAVRIGEITQQPPELVLEVVSDPEAHERWGVPGPGLEGYLFPDTYRFAEGAPLDDVIGAMVERYKGYWKREKRVALARLELTEREVVTLASIVQAEARVEDEMPAIASVYHNRVQRGWPLEADPTVLYALGGHRDRLLYAAIDSVADNPYNTYRNPGIPPGPIGAPGSAALDATLQPADEPYMFFVASPDGRHIFSRTLAEHNRAKAQARRDRERRAREARSASNPTGP